MYGEGRGNEVPEGFAITVIVFDDRSPRPAYLDLALRVNERYARQFGIRFRHLTRCSHQETLPPYWARVALVADAHREASHDPKARGFVIGLDSDAVIASLSFDLRQELVEVPASKAVVVVREAPFRESGETLCSGFFGVRLGSTGGAFLDDWLARYDATSWRQERGRWRTDEAWAGDAYEQGQLNHVAGRHCQIMHELPQWVFNSGFPRSVTDHDEEELVLPGILHCTPWPGEEATVREERARCAFQELLDNTLLSNVSIRRLKELQEDELARSAKLLGRPPRHPPPAQHQPTAALVVTPAERASAAWAKNAAEVTAVPTATSSEAPQVLQGHAYMALD